MTPEFNAIAFTIIGSLLGVLSYFLKLLHTDLRQACEDVGKLKGKIELVQQEHTLRLEKNEAVTQQKIDRLTDEVTRLTKVLEKAFNNKP